jgi:hypothetical protein
MAKMTPAERKEFERKEAARLKAARPKGPSVGESLGVGMRAALRGAGGAMASGLANRARSTIINDKQRTRKAIEDIDK